MRLIPGGGGGGWNNVEIINDGTQIKSNWVGASLPSLHRIPQDNNAAQEEEKRLLPHTSLEFNANQGEAHGFPTSPSGFQCIE